MARKNVTFTDFDLLPVWLRIDFPRFCTTELPDINPGRDKKSHENDEKSIKVTDFTGKITEYKNIRTCAKKLKYHPVVINKYIKGALTHVTLKFEYVEKTDEN